MTDKCALQHSAVQVHVMCCRYTMIKPFTALFHDPPDLPGFYSPGIVIKHHGLINGHKKAVRVGWIKYKSVSGAMADIQGGNGFLISFCLANNGKRPI